MQDEAGNDYLKLAATNYSVLKLICGRKTPNASLASSERLQCLKSKRNDALNDVEAPAVSWEDDGTDNAVLQPCKKRKLAHEKVVNINVGEVSVAILCQQKRTNTSDLLVKLQGNMLQAVFDYVKDDCDACKSKRSYQKSGNFRKGQAKGSDDSANE